MVSTVTLSTAAFIANAPTSSLAAIVIVALVVMLIGKDLFSGQTSARSRRVGQALSVVVLPLATVFVATLVVQIVDVLLQ